ncbi:MAG: DUF1854 domain-containing protein [Oscillospiraceae bacterium]|nr:DUF1854 domain-containing protein [Oscillospiraceae bacterium]
MAKTYVAGTDVQFTSADLCVVNMVYQGQTYENLTPKRLFPFNDKNKYITLLDEDQKEVAIIRDLNTLTPESRAVVETALEGFYFLPKITKVYSLHEKFGLFTFDAETDKGRIQFDMGNLHYNIKRLEGNRVLFRDMNDNRYEIADYTKLDKKSMRLIYPYI